MEHHASGYSVSVAMFEKLRGNAAEVKIWITAFNTEGRDQFIAPLLMVELVEREHGGIYELDILGHLHEDTPSPFGRVVLTPYPEGVTHTLIECTINTRQWAREYCSSLATHLREIAGFGKLTPLQSGIIEVVEELRRNSRPTTDVSIARGLGEKNIRNPQGEEYSRRWIIENRKKLREMGYDVKK